MQSGFKDLWTCVFSSHEPLESMVFGSTNHKNQDSIMINVLKSGVQTVILTIDAPWPQGLTTLCPLLFSVSWDYRIVAWMK
jgi:hypothetical protein